MTAVVGGSKWKYTDRSARLEVTLNGVPATDLLCWPFLRQSDRHFCACGVGDKAHVLELCCPGAVNDALGAPKKRGCKKEGTCGKRHPAAAEVLSALVGWHEASGRGQPVVGRTTAAMLRVIGGASAATAGSEKPLPCQQSGDNAGGQAGGDAEPMSITPEGAVIVGALSDGAHRQSAFQLRGQRCSVPADAVRRRLAGKALASPYVARFIREPFFPLMLADDRLRQLLTSRKAAKEISEAYGIADKVAAAMRAVAAQKRRQARGEAAGAAAVEGGCGGDAYGDDDAECLVTGAGFVVLDVCSGKGFASVLVSLLLPLARVIMLDADGGMDLSHVAACPNLSFEALDLFSDDAPHAIQRLASMRRLVEGSGGEGSGGNEGGREGEGAGGGGCVVMGVHLCGALSPRLATLCCRMPCVDALCFVPCCLKGALGSYAVRAAKASLAVEAAIAAEAATAETTAEATAEATGAGRAGRGTADVATDGSDGSDGVINAAYRVLVEVLAGLCRDERAGSLAGSSNAATAKGSCAVGEPQGEVTVQFDDLVMSPKNGFISVIKGCLLREYS